VQLPMFSSRHVLVNVVPGARYVPSGTVTSVMKRAQLHDGAAAARSRDNPFTGMKEKINATNNISEVRVKRCFIRAS